MAGLIDTFVRGANDVASASGVDLDLANLRQLLATEQGELPWRPEFGVGFEVLRHVPNDDMLSELAATRVRDAVARWLPDLPLEAVDARRSPRDSERLQVAVRIRARAGAPPSELVIERDL